MTLKELFEHYVFLTVTDISISNFNKTNFSTYNGYATYIQSQLIQENYSLVNRYLFSIAIEIEEIYGISNDEAIYFVAMYFYNKKWESYYQTVNMIRNHFGNFISF